MGSPDAAEIAASLREHPERADLARAVKEAALDAAKRRDAALFAAAGSAGELDPERAETPHGNVATLLKEGASDESQWALASALLGLAFVDDSEGATAATGELLWLATHTKVDAFPALEAVLPEPAPLIAKLGELADAPQQGASDFGCVEALMAAAVLRTSRSEAAAREITRLATSGKNLALRALLRPPDPELREAPMLQGELSSPPRAPLMTALLAFTLVLFVVEAARTVARFVFSYRRPTELSLSARGLEVKQRTELMGRVLRDRAMLVPLDQLVRVTREVRFGRLGLYAGLVALVLGSYFGMGLLVDGVRVWGGSFALVSMAVVLVIGGLVLDYGLTSLSDSVRGKCRVIVVPSKGKPLCVGALDAARTDAVLASLADYTQV